MSALAPEPGEASRVTDDCTFENADFRENVTPRFALTSLAFGFIATVASARTARELGVKVPEEILLRADRVVTRLVALTAEPLR